MGVCCCSLVGTKACDNCLNNDNGVSKGYYEFKPYTSPDITIGQLLEYDKPKEFSDEELLKYALSKLGCSRETLVEWYRINKRMVEGSKEV